MTLSLAFFWTACSHVVLIKSSPPGATVYIDDEPKGITPLFYEEASGWGRRYELRLQKPGYLEEHISLQQDQWLAPCLWPSICLMPVTFCVSGSGLLFSRTLRDEYNFLLRPKAKESEVEVKPADEIPLDSHAPLQVPLVSPEASDKAKIPPVGNKKATEESPSVDKKIMPKKEKTPSTARSVNKNFDEQKTGVEQTH